MRSGDALNVLVAWFVCGRAKVVPHKLEITASRPTTTNKGIMVGIKIDDLALTVRSRNCLIAEGMNTVEDVANFISQNGVKGLMKIPNLGTSSIHEIISEVCGALIKQCPLKMDAEKYNENSEFHEFDLRDKFAIKAMHALLTICTDFRKTNWRTMVATDSYMIADAMIDARKATQQQTINGA